MFCGHPSQNYVCVCIYVCVYVCACFGIDICQYLSFYVCLCESNTRVCYRVHVRVSACVFGVLKWAAFQSIVGIGMCPTQHTHTCVYVCVCSD